MTRARDLADIADKDITGTLTADDIVLSGGVSKTGDLTFDVSGDIILDAEDNGEIQLHDGGTYYGLLRRDNNNFQLYSIVQDGDMVFRGNDGGSNVTALTLDMSDAGTATFNNKVGIGITPTTSYGNVLQIHDTGTSGANLRLTDNTSGSATGNGFEIIQIGVNNYTMNRENGFMSFSTNDQQRLLIDASGAVGINCTPDGNSKLQIKGTQEIQSANSTNGWQLYTYTDNTFRFNYNGSGGDELTLTSDGDLGIGTSSAEKKVHIFDSTQTNQSIRFGNPSAVPYGEINYNSSGSEHLYITSKGTTSGYGNIVFQVGGTPSEAMRILAGGGLTFNGDTAAANALDDYETGTWTPALSYGNIVIYYASYVKVGQLVTAYCYIRADGVPSNGTTFLISGLPFTANNNSSYYPLGSLGYTGNFNTNNWTDPHVAYNNSYLYFHRNDGSHATIKNSDVTGANRELIVQVIYHTTI